MSIQRIPIPLRDGETATPEQERAFVTGPVIAIYDAPLLMRGDVARFEVRLLDGRGRFTVHAETVDGTARADDGDYHAISADYTFIDSGTIEVLTGGVGTVENEDFFVRLTPVTPALIVRDLARGSLRGFDCVYEPGVYDEFSVPFAVFDDGVYDDGVYSTEDAANGVYLCN